MLPLLTKIVFAVLNLFFLPIVYFLYPVLIDHQTLHGVRHLLTLSPFCLQETANRTLEDLDAYFDKDSGHGVIIPIGDKLSKQHHRPQEAIEAERRRIEMTTESMLLDKKLGGGMAHVEELR
jgi:hypothetical protein